MSQNTSKITIATHDGIFHADDVFAVAALKLIYPNATIIRTRKPDELAEADLRVDVGGKLDSAAGYFDHHQGLPFTRINGVPYAAFGLVWLRFGIEICGGDAKVAQRVEDRLVQQIDAADSKYSLWTSLNGDVQPLLVSDLISAFNPLWNEDFQTNLQLGFAQAMTLAEVTLTRAIAEAKAYCEAEEMLEAAIAAAIQGNTKILVLDRFVPWQEAVLASEAAAEILFVVFPSQGWKVQGVPTAPNSQTQRKPLPVSWRGKPAAELQALTGIPEMVFCHQAGFIAGTTSKESALELAKLAVANQE